MISCTEFIPAYSELFTYIENNYGRKEVDVFWNYLFEPTGDGIPLINFVQKEGIKGCYSYWMGTLNEEAADFTMYLNEKAGWYKSVMHKCPSKGRLLQLKDEIGITPYHDYCLHCDYYRLALDKVGLVYQFDFTDIDNAACSELVYDPKVFDGRIIVDENTVVVDRKASDNEYFHRDFHSSMNMGVEYLGSKYGKKDVVDYLTMYTKDVYCKEIEAMKEIGLEAIKNKIEDTYKKEKAEDALTINYTPDKLEVKISYCPAVKHLKETGRVVSDWYVYTTETVMETLAKCGGFKFEMKSYDAETGKAEYCFQNKK